MNVEKVRELGLCLSCEICHASCPLNAIDMEYESGQFLPTVDGNKCSSCGLCIELCPGIGVFLEEGSKNKNANSILKGPCISAYSAFSKDLSIWEVSTSGGVISDLLIRLIEDGIYEGAFILNFDSFKGAHARLEIANNKEKILSGAKSKYIPASVYNVIKTLAKEKNPRYVIIGTPCQITGIKKYIEKMKIFDEGLLFLGLFCDQTLNYNFIRYFEDKYSKSGESIEKFDFRNKEKDGWPGHIKIRFNSGREIDINREERIKLKRYFQLKRCIICTDKLNSSSDISFGDCYIRGKDRPGRSSVIIRTLKGKKIWEDYCNLFVWEESSIDSIRSSQSLSKKSKNLKFRMILGIKEGLIDWGSSYEENLEFVNEFERRQMYIKWGKEYKTRRIRLSSRFLPSSRLKILRPAIPKLIKGGLSYICHYLNDDLSDTEPKMDISGKGKNIIILGGELFNKGAQAMTFTVVDQLKSRFPMKNIFLFSNWDFERDMVERNKYKFEIRPWTSVIGMELLNYDQKSERTITDPENLNELHEILQNASFIVDISGYLLYSRKRKIAHPFNYESLLYITRIMIAKKYSIPYYILPQSFGPFDYPLLDRIILFPLLKKYMRYPAKILVREKKGAEYLEEFTSDNVEIRRDIVLLNGGYDLNHIFNKETKLKLIGIEKSSVGIIPNSRLMERVDKENMYAIYDRVINTLLEAGKKVYIIRHSYEDHQICRKIKKRFAYEDDVKLINDDLNAIELEKTIAQLEFIVASRYHSIIHAYKHGVPALTIGWADKYYELLEDFHELEYLIDGREGLHIDLILNRLRQLIKRYKWEREIIEKRLNSMKLNGAFDVFVE